MLPLIGVPTWFPAPRHSGPVLRKLLRAAKLRVVGSDEIPLCLLEMELDPFFASLDRQKG